MTSWDVLAYAISWLALAVSLVALWTSARRFRTWDLHRSVARLHSEAIEARHRLRNLEMDVGAIEGQVFGDAGFVAEGSEED